MVQNRKKIIELFVGNISNAIVHDILEKAIDDEEISNKYQKEINISFNKAKEYREKINPKYSPLPEKDIEHIKSQIRNKVISKLNQRISQKYENIDLNLIEELIDKSLRNTNIIYTTLNPASTYGM